MFRLYVYLATTIVIVPAAPLLGDGLSAWPGAHRATSGPATVIFVDDDAAAGGDGASWNTAYRFLQDALDAADMLGGAADIHIAQGTQQPDRSEAAPTGSGDRAATFEIADGVVLRGGYAGLNAPDPDARDTTSFVTVLSGDLAGDDGPDFANRADNALHVVIADNAGNTAGLDGVTITGGNADGGVVDDRVGGGLRAWGSSIVVADCVLTSNSANAGGGAISFRASGAALVTSCVFDGNQGGSGGAVESRTGAAPLIKFSEFRNNMATNVGGGLYINASGAVPAQCTFTDNTAGQGGGGVYVRSANPSITGCAFTGNSSDTVGGAMLLSSSADPVITDCDFTANDAQDRGGAIAVLFLSDPQIRRCRFDDNTANEGGAIFCNADANPVITSCDMRRNIGTISGGAVFSSDISNPTFINCLMLDNSTSGDGGAVHQTSGSPAYMNCTIINNTADGQGGGMRISLGAVTAVSNCIVYGNTDSAGQQESSQLSGSGYSVQYACIQGLTGGLGGAGNTGADPEFAPSPGRLSACSPLIDAGNNAAVPVGITSDLAQNPRITDDPDTADTGSGDVPIVDMGAFEFQSPACPADCAPIDARGAVGNGTVNIDDLLMVVQAFGGNDIACDAAPRETCGNGVINIDDLLEVISSFGGCP